MPPHLLRPLPRHHLVDHPPPRLQHRRHVRQRHGLEPPRLHQPLHRLLRLAGLDLHDDGVDREPLPQHVDDDGVLVPGAAAAVAVLDVGRHGQVDPVEVRAAPAEPDPPALVLLGRHPGVGPRHPPRAHRVVGRVVVLLGAVRDVLDAVRGGHGCCGGGWVL
ncbi:hypothetical protein PG996_008213 [Apiospora saccharicola]|uniref:Uncharacterized protein n=1 Tax=Apiospora saccharicola TaxID=335842 RepID=A0ABR1UZT1_9PEZI